MIFIYLAAIVVFVAVAVIIAVVSKKKENKRLEKLSREVLEKNETVDENNKQNEFDLQQEKIVENRKSNQEDVFEDFSLDADEEQISAKDDEIDEDLDRKFAEYQKFLRENLEMDENELDEDIEDSDFVPQGFRPQKFTPERMRMRDHASNNISPNMKEVLLSNPLARESLEQESKKAQDDQNNSDN